VHEVTSSLTIVGLGYVGLPLAQEACRSGLNVTGLDTDSSVVSGLMNGVSHIDDIDSVDLTEMLGAGFLPTTDPTCIRDSDVVVICVPTPLDEDGTPDLGAVKAATRTISEHLQSGSLVVLESTTYPGTTEDTVRPLLEEGSGLTAGIDFNLAYSPERIDPGNPEWGLRNTPKIVGGLTPACTEQAVQFYEQIVDTVVPTVGLREAEFAKLLENTYRHINIALINEMAVFCHEVGIDLWASIEAAATKPFGFEAFRPGPGIGGHCIPIDPNYLSWVARSVGYRLRFVELAQEVSERMPAYVARRTQDALNRSRKALNGSHVVLAGVSYKANVSDQRETPARPLAKHLFDLGAEVSFVDPHVESFEAGGREVPRIDDLEEAAGCADIVVLLQPHDEFLDSDALASADCILDTSGRLTGENVDRL
jgi:nucleotide sugar dehydrogenase